MPLPAALASAYAQYKKDTDFVASWLGSTAKAYGYNGPVADDEPSQRYTRLKGKARTEAKKAKATGNVDERSESHSKKKYTISMKRFVPLAIFIASERPPIPIPASLLATLTRVITARTTFSEDLAADSHFNVASELLSSGGHTHFVRVLQDVHALLHRDSGSSASDCTSLATPEVGDNPGLDSSFLTRFHALKLYEPSAEHTATKDPEKPNEEIESSFEMEGDYEAERPTSLQDALFAYSLLVCDLTAIRNSVKEIWRAVPGGGVDVASAAVATDTAISLARNIVKGFLSNLGDTHEWQGGVVGLAKIYAGIPDHYDQDVQTQRGDGQVLNAKNAPQTDTATERPFYIVLFAFEFLEKRTLNFPRSILSEIYKILTIVLEIRKCIPTKHLWPVRDELINCVNEFDTSRQLNFNFVFAAQVYLDVRNTLGEQMVCGHVKLMQFISFATQDIVNHIRISTGRPFSRIRRARYLLQRMEMFETDIIANCTQFYKQRLGPENSLSQDFGPFYLLECCPVLSGLILFWFRAEYHNLSIEIANLTMSIFAAAHLWRSLCISDLARKRWDDMWCVSWILSTNDLSTDEAGEQPKDLEGCFQGFCLKLGFLPAAFHCDPSTPYQEVFRSYNKIENSLPVSSMFFNRYVESGSKAEWATKEVERVMAYKSWNCYDSDPEAPSNPKMFKKNGQSQRT